MAAVVSTSLFHAIMWCWTLLGAASRCLWAPAYIHVYIYILLRLSACVECVGSLQSNVCCDRNLTCGE